MTGVLARDVAPWVILAAALDLAAWLALPLAVARWSAARPGTAPRWWIPLAVGVAVRALRGVAGSAAAVRTRPGVARWVGELALSTGDPEDAGAAFVATFVAVRAVEGALPALVSGALASGVALALATLRVDPRAVAALAVGGAVLLSVRVAQRGHARARVDRTVAARASAIQWLSAASRGRYEVTGTAREGFLTAVAAAGQRWAVEDAAYGSWRRVASLLQLLAGALAGSVALAVMGVGGMAHGLGDGPGGGLAGWLALAVAVAPGLSAARALEEVLSAQRTLAALGSQPVAPTGHHPLPPSTDAVVLSGVSVRYGDSVALDNVSVSVPLRGVTAVVGPNGAGKSTLAQVVAGRRVPDAGSCMAGGVSMATVDPDAVAMVPQQPCVVESLTVADNVRLVAPGATDAEIADAVRALGLTVQPGHRAGALSRGEQRRIAVARALLKPSRLVVLDEPDAWLDRAGRDVLARALTVEGTRRAVVLVTHRADLVRWVDTVVVLGADHRVEAVGTPAAVAGSVTFRALVLDAAGETHGDPPEDRAHGQPVVRT